MKSHPSWRATGSCQLLWESQFYLGIWPREAAHDPGDGLYPCIHRQHQADSVAF